MEVFNLIRACCMQSRFFCLNVGTIIYWLSCPVGKVQRAVTLHADSKTAFCSSQGDRVNTALRRRSLCLQCHAVLCCIWCGYVRF